VSYVLESAMPLPALPPRDQVEQVYAVCCLAFLFALVASQLYLQASKYWQPRFLVSHSHEAGVEIDLGSECGYREKASSLDRHERCYSFVEKALVHVRSLFEDNNVATRPLRGPYLRAQNRRTQFSIQRNGVALYFSLFCCIRAKAPAALN
jgi:hypothetical protein